MESVEFSSAAGFLTVIFKLSEDARAVLESSEFSANFVEAAAKHSILRPALSDFR